MFTRMVVSTTLWLAVMAAILFLAADTWRWPQGWVFLGESGLSAFAIGCWLAHHDPALLETRLSAPWQRGQQPWDRIFLPAAFPVFIGWMVLMALDARRFAWSGTPLWAQTTGAALIALCMLVAWRTFRVNSFAAPQIRLQPQRAQHVVTEGPYRVVRHPMYAGALLYFVGLPLLLGSRWGLALVPLLVAALAARSVGEERMLRRELTGYDAYAQRVRFRLVPGLW
jgi:protein-S-isoprenylcysteine O-methyltransferase Ste14